MSSKIQAFDNLNFESLTGHKPEYKQVEWNAIISDHDLNIRSEEKYSHDPELHELAYSIIKFGLRQPIVLYKDKTKRNSYHIWHGQRRLSAIRLIQNNEVLNYSSDAEKYSITEEDKENIYKVPCLILPEPEDSTQRILRQIAENEHRKDIDNLELCKQYHQLLKSNYGWSQDILAKKLGKSKQLISDICGLNRIDAVIQKLISEIQLYGYTLKKSDLSYLQIGLWDNLSEKSFTKKIGIKQLRKIATSENQPETFWELFSSKCSEEDAELLGLSSDNKTEKKEINVFKAMHNDYFKLSGKFQNASDKYKEKLKVKKAAVAKEMINYLMQENGLTSKDLK
jgi:ParB-like chromosome segregation protein Spo0J